MAAAPGISKNCQAASAAAAERCQAEAHYSACRPAGTRENFPVQQDYVLSELVSFLIRLQWPITYNVSSSTLQQTSNANDRLGHETRHFNIGQYRRMQSRGKHESHDASFFDHTNLVSVPSPFYSPCTHKANGGLADA